MAARTRSRTRVRSVSKSEDKQDKPKVRRIVTSETAEEGELDVTQQDKAIASYKKKIKSPLSGIRAFCVECMGGYVGLVNQCPSENCALHPFRMGKNTLHARHGQANPEAAKRMKSISQSKTKKRRAKR